MDLFKLTTTGSPTTFTGGEAINGYDRVTWVERYNRPGDFTIEAKLSSGLTNFLPIGSMISHVNTMEVMIVENHEIDEKLAEDPSVSISGRSFVSYLENRMVGVLDARLEDDWHQYVMAAGYTWVQIAKIINDHIVNPPANTNDALVNITAAHSIVGTGVSVQRTFDHGELWDYVEKLLKIDDLGIRTIRRNPFGVPGGSATETRINIYKGIDKTANIMFSWVSGDIQEAHYLITQKNDKNCALVQGSHFQVMVDGAETKYDRRIMLVKAEDVDKDLSLTLPAILAALTVRGQQALAAQNYISISQIDLSTDARPQFRRDYNIGDIVSIDGNYGAISVRRVSEYAEIEDENGTSGHPTLSELGS